MATEYARTPRSTVNRYRPRGAYDRATIHSIIDSTPVLHVSFIPVPPTDDPFPAILPMIGVTGAFGPRDDGETSDIYLHGYVSSRLMRLPSSSPSPTNTTATEATPVCIAATRLDGLVLALTPNHHSCNYGSAVVHGWAHRVTDEAEVLYAMERITENMLPSRWENSRVPPNRVEMQSTAILRVEVASASAKLRAGGPGEDRGDLRDEELMRRCWTGVVPAWVQWGEPVAARTNKVEEVPGYISEWVNRENERNREHAIDATKDKK